MVRATVFLIALLHAVPCAAADAGAWWIWPAALFAVSFAIGIVAVVAGIGGGVLFVPVVGAFFPFHLDFVRGAGLLLALSGALSAGPALLRSGMASLRLAMPCALIGSIASIFGALLGLALPAEVLQTALGVSILLIAALMSKGRSSQPGGIAVQDRLAAALGLRGVFHDPAAGRDVQWAVRRTPAALVAFAGIGLIAGMFGLGAGWANVPVLNLLMGAPLKLAVGTSGVILSVIDTSAAWVYFNRGAVLPILVAPSIAGVMLGARIGVRLLRTARASSVRRIVIVLLLLSGARALLKGLGVWN